MPLGCVLEVETVGLLPDLVGAGEGQEPEIREIMNDSVSPIIQSCKFHFVNSGMRCLSSIPIPISRHGQVSSSFA